MVEYDVHKRLKKCVSFICLFYRFTNICVPSDNIISCLKPGAPHPLIFTEFQVQEIQLIMIISISLGPKED